MCIKVDQKFKFRHHLLNLCFPKLYDLPFYLKKVDILKNIQVFFSMQLNGHEVLGFKRHAKSTDEVFTNHETYSSVWRLMQQMPCEFI